MGCAGPVLPLGSGHAASGYDHRLPVRPPRRPRETGGSDGAHRFHHKNLGLDKADRDRIGRELEGSKTAAGVLAPVSESKIVASKLATLGGTTETHEVSDEALEEAHTAAMTQEP